jgi:membrane protein implicated in regulation of membrane protease activity
MSAVVPRRFSRNWWALMAAATTVIGTVVFLILAFATDIQSFRLIGYWLGLTLLGDTLTALSMEAVAPTRVIIGPGDRRANNDLPTERAIVVSGFGDADTGEVQVRGEIWRAKRVADGRIRLAVGASVRVLNRDGLTLLVSPDDS